MIDSSTFYFLIVVILIAVIFDFANGFNDAANAIATVVSTRVMTPLAAIIMASGMNFVGAISGTGLGLTILKRAVERHGGMVEFESEIDKGTIWRVTLPLTASAKDL